MRTIRSWGAPHRGTGWETTPGRWLFALFVPFREGEHLFVTDDAGEALRGRGGMDDEGAEVEEGFLGAGPFLELDPAPLGHELLG